MLYKRPIAILSGHNQYNPGATAGGYSEFDFTPSWARKTFEMVNKKLDDSIAMLINSYQHPNLEDKKEMIDKIDALFAIEIHFNSNVNAKGSETLHYPNSEKGMKLANCIQEEFERSNIFQPNRGIKVGHYWNNGEQDGILYLLRSTKCPTVIVEPDFMSNYENIIENEEKGPDAIAEGIVRFYRGTFNEG